MQAGSKTRVHHVCHTHESHQLAKQSTPHNMCESCDDGGTIRNILRYRPQVWGGHHRDTTNKPLEHAGYCTKLRSYILPSMPLVVSKQGDDSSRTRVGAKARNRKKHRAKQPNTFLHRSGHMPRDPSMKLSPKHGSQVHKHNQPSAPHHMGDWRNEQHDVCSLFSLQTVGWRGWPVLRELGAAIRLGFMLWCGAVADHINVSNNWVMMPGAALHSSPGCQHAPDAIAPSVLCVTSMEATQTRPEFVQHPMSPNGLRIASRWGPSDLGIMPCVRAIFSCHR